MEYTETVWPLSSATCINPYSVPFARNPCLRILTPKAEPQGIFGIPLNVSIKYANVAISLTNDNGESFIYGYVPIVVAKCGVFLKEKGTHTQLVARRRFPEVC